MADLRTNYLGLTLKNPLIVGSSELTNNMHKLTELEQAGVGAVVLKSLFEEQILLDKLKHAKDPSEHGDLHVKMSSIFPNLEHDAPQEHLTKVKKIKQTLSIPVIASLNAVTDGTWYEYAPRLEDTGVDALELNFYSPPADPIMDSNYIEEKQIELFQGVKERVSIPLAVKLSPCYTNGYHFFKRLAESGVDGLVLFNRFLYPGIDVVKEESSFPVNFSQAGDHRMSLRAVGLLYGESKASLCAANGFLTWENILEAVLAGADAVQVVTALYKNSIPYVIKLLKGIAGWMDQKGYSTLTEFKGKLSRKNNEDVWAYTRSQYVKQLLRPEEYMQSFLL